MEVLVLQAFVSLLLVTGSLLLFGYSARQRDYDHADRLALAPLDDDGEGGGRAVAATGEGAGGAPGASSTSTSTCASTAAGPATASEPTESVTEPKKA